MTWLLLALLSTSFAEDSKFAGTEKPAEEAAKPEGSLAAEFGGSLTTGNSDFFTLASTVKGGYKWNKNKVSLIAGALYGAGRVDADGSGALNGPELTAPRVRNAQRFTGDARYDRFFGERNSLYLLAGAFHDPFGGYDLRSHQQFGYSRLLVKSESTEVVTEIGADYAQEKYVSSVDPRYQDIFAARVMIGLKHKFNESVSFEDTFEVYENVIDFADVRILNSAALVSKLSGKFSLKVSHTLIFDNVPVEGFQKLDQTTMVTFVATIF